MVDSRRRCGVATTRRGRERSTVVYHVLYSTAQWQSRRHPLLPDYVEECQVVRQDLTQGQRLYVELIRRPGVPIQITVARLEAAYTRWGQQKYRTLRFLRADEFALVEVTESSA